MTDDHAPGTLPAADPPGTDPPLRPEHLGEPAQHNARDLITETPLRPLPGTRPDEPEREPEREPEPDEPELPAAQWAVPPRRARTSVRMRRTLTKRSRRDLDAALTRMCQLVGWQGTTLNPDMSAADKMAILSTRYGQLAVETDPETLYLDLLDLSAVAMGWAQGIHRRHWRDRKRAQRKRKRKEKRAKRKRKR